MNTKTSAEWWKQVKADPVKLEEWLIKQYRGEVTAATRIIQLGEKFGAVGSVKRLLDVIADQERQHAEWIKVLLENRSLPIPDTSDSENRYWAETLGAIDSLDTGTAIATHAEEMRLERIYAIANDIEAHLDIRETFTKILKDELFHAKAFRGMSTDEALNRTMSAHEAGMAALGLTN